jgi:hypothetical protein
MADADSDPGDFSGLAYWSADFGMLTEREIAREFWSPVGKSLLSDGIEYVGDVESTFNLPDGLVPPAGNTMPEASLAIVALLALSVFVKQGAADWAVAKVCDQIWERKLRSPFEKLLKRRKDEGYGSTPLRISLGAWYDKDRVYIGINGDVHADEDQDRLLSLFPAAQQKGLAWLKEHAATKPVLIYRVDKGVMAAQPEQLNSIPK